MPSFLIWLKGFINMHLRKDIDVINCSLNGFFRRSDSLSDARAMLNSVFCIISRHKTGEVT